MNHHAQFRSQELDHSSMNTHSFTLTNQCDVGKYDSSRQLLRSIMLYIDRQDRQTANWENFKLSVRVAKSRRVEEFVDVGGVRKGCKFCEISRCIVGSDKGMWLLLALDKQWW